MSRQRARYLKVKATPRILEYSADKDPQQDSPDRIIEGEERLYEYDTETGDFIHPGKGRKLNREEVYGSHKRYDGSHH